MSQVTVIPAFRFEVIGPIRGKGRPRFNTKTGHAYTPGTTVSAEERIRGEWRASDQPFLHGPISLTVVAYHSRPANHYRVDGTLGKAGIRDSLPCRKPDWDNVCKLVADSLNGLAYGDDSQIVKAMFERHWAPRDQPERLVISGAQCVPGTEYEP